MQALATREMLVRGSSAGSVVLESSHPGTAA